MTRSLARSQTPGLLALAVGTAILSYATLELVTLAREWQVTLCLVVVAVLGGLAGAAMRAVKWTNAAIVLTAVSTIVFALSCFYLYDSGRWWLLATLLFLPGAALAAFASTGLSRAIAN